ncbi:unnamed protein product [Rhizoctonia solani]|uniref:Uncharacterized protein n=1 Tax=Rhizoctonia solani TaxID=456999 RepID=A0A8H3AYF6_9AGAM|nr:unnamed protein product [Rhizoctonia solani]
MPSSAKLKETTTILLIGDALTSKQNLAVFADAVCTGKTADIFLDSRDTVTTLSENNPIYPISCTDGTKLNVVSYPEQFSTDESASTDDVLNWLQKWTTTVDAFIVLIDSSTSTINSGTASALETLSFIFPRSIYKNVFFLFVAANPSEGDASIDIESTTGLPSWLSSEHIFPMEDMVAQKENVRTRTQAKPGTSATLRKHFSRKFLGAKEDLQKLLEHIDQSVVQAWDMGDLYMRAARIESELYSYLGDVSTLSIGAEILQKIHTLVGQYCLLASSPDFATHVELVSALVHGGSERGIAGMDNSVRKLNDARNLIRVLGSGSEKFPKGFVIY